MSARKIRAKEIPTAPPAADPDSSWLSAQHTQMGGGLDNYRETWTLKPEEIVARACTHAHPPTIMDT